MATILLDSTMSHPFYGTRTVDESTTTRGYVKVLFSYCASSSSPNEVVFKIEGVKAALTNTALSPIGTYAVDGLIELSDINNEENKKTITINKSKYLNSEENDIVSEEDLEIAQLIFKREKEERVEQIKFSLLKNSGSHGFSFYYQDGASGDTNPSEGWNIIEGSDSIQTFEIKIPAYTAQPEEPEGLALPEVKSKIRPRFLFMGWNFARQFDFKRLVTKLDEQPIEPIGYFYGHETKDGEEVPDGCIKHTINGVDYVGAVLPKLPEYDADVYPWAVILKRTNTVEYDLIISSIQLCFNTTTTYGSGVVTIGTASTNRGSWISFACNGSKFTRTNSGTSSVFSGGDPVWCSRELMTATESIVNGAYAYTPDDSLYFTGTAVIPIYE